MKQAREAVHQEPVWRERSNFIIAAPISDGGDVKTEQIWARKDEDGHFEVCCIPFFVYDLALGDIVETDDDYLIQRIVKSSGRYVFRVWLGESNYPKDALIAKLTELGALIEWSSNNLFAVDAVDKKHAQIVADYLTEHEKSNHLVYETGRTQAA